MAQTDFLRRYFDTGLALGQLTRARAEELVRELVKAGEVQREQTQQFVDSLLDRSRKNAEMLAAVASAEVRKQLGRAVGGGRGGSQSTKPASGAKEKAKGPAKKSTAKKSTAKKSTAKKAAPKKAAAKKAAPKKAAAKKPAAPKESAKKTPAKKAPAKKASAAPSAVSPIPTAVPLTPLSTDVSAAPTKATDA
jgi:hypothetical protein